MIDLEYAFLELGYGREFKQFVRMYHTLSQGKDRMFIFHPQFTGVWPKEIPAKLIGTDFVIAPDWLNLVEPMLRLYIPSERAKAKLVQYFGQASIKSKNVNLTSGFAGTPALYKVIRLSRIRTANLKSGKPPLLVMLASGVAYAQVGTFKEMISQNVIKLAQGRLLIFIQGGYGSMGMDVYRLLNSFITVLETSDPKFNGLSRSVILHWGPTIDGAIHAFEAVSWLSNPLIILVKASEMTGFALTANIPQIVTGALGRQEMENIIYAASIPDSPIFIPADVSHRIISDIKLTFPPAEIDQYRMTQNIQKHTVPINTNPLDLAMDYVKSGKIVEINRSYMLDIIKDCG